MAKVERRREEADHHLRGALLAIASLAIGAMTVAYIKLHGG